MFIKKVKCKARHRYLQWSQITDKGQNPEHMKKKMGTRCGQVMDEAIQATN